MVETERSDVCYFCLRPLVCRVAGDEFDTSRNPDADGDVLSFGDCRAHVACIQTYAEAQRATPPRLAGEVGRGKVSATAEEFNRGVLGPTQEGPD